MPSCSWNYCWVLNFGQFGQELEQTANDQSYRSDVAPLATGAASPTTRCSAWEYVEEEIGGSEIISELPTTSEPVAIRSKLTSRDAACDGG